MNTHISFFPSSFLLRIMHFNTRKVALKIHEVHDAWPTIMSPFTQNHAFLSWSWLSRLTHFQPSRLLWCWFNDHDHDAYPPTLVSRPTGRNRYYAGPTSGSRSSSREGRVIPLDSSVFAVKKVNLAVHENAAEHRTSDLYANGSTRDDCLILRRGSAFKMQILFSRDFLDKSDIVNFVFTVSGKFAQ